MEKNDSDRMRKWLDDDDAPAWETDVFDRAEIRDGDKLVRPASGTLTKRGRPKLETPKKQMTLRLDSDIIERFRVDGPGWQARLNDALRKALTV